MPMTGRQRTYTNIQQGETHAGTYLLTIASGVTSTMYASTHAKRPNGIPTHHLVVLAYFDRHVRPFAPLNASSVVAVSSDVARHRVQRSVLAHRLQDVGSWKEVPVGRQVHCDGATEHVNGHRNLFARVAPGASCTEVHLSKGVDWKCV